jgi:hypothetical protein
LTYEGARIYERGVGLRPVSHDEWTALIKSMKDETNDEEPTT